MNYITWRLIADPNIRVMIISKTSGMANKFLAGIKSRLTGPSYRKLQTDFAPPEGFQANS